MIKNDIKKMPDYSKTIIYKICCKDINIKEIYVGSTCNFINRVYNHKSNCYNENTKKFNYKVYKFIRDNGGWANWDMIMVAEANLENKLQKEKLEREYYEELGASLNGINPSRNIKEYYQDNKEKFKEYNKEYREDNKEELKEYHKEYYQDNKEEIKEKQKIYSDSHKEEINERKKKYYKDKKEEIYEYKTKKFNCEICDGKYNNNNKSQHFKTKKHLSKIID
tara:strand:+ start:102 stop:770 length:669 start_codon:yes stop_codon:yes gene_type:complete